MVSICFRKNGFTKGSSSCSFSQFLLPWPEYHSNYPFLWFFNGAIKDGNLGIQVVQKMLFICMHECVMNLARDEAGNEERTRSASTLCAPFCFPSHTEKSLTFILTVATFKGATFLQLMLKLWNIWHVKRGRAYFWCVRVSVCKIIPQHYSLPRNYTGRKINDSIFLK